MTSETEARLRALHQPSRLDVYQPNPYDADTRVETGRSVCVGCGGVMFHPCPTIRVLDGLPVPELDEEELLCTP